MKTCQCPKFWFLDDSDRRARARLTTQEKHLDRPASSESASEHIRSMPSRFGTLVAAFPIVGTNCSVAKLKHRLRISLDGRRAKTAWRVFGRRETTTSIMFDVKKTRVAPSFCIANVNDAQGPPTQAQLFQQKIKRTLKSTPFSNDF